MDDRSLVHGVKGNDQGSLLVPTGRRFTIK